MKLTTVLCKQHIGRQFNAKWIAMGQVNIQNNGIKEKLEDLGLKVHDPLAELEPKLSLEDPEELHMVTPELLEDKPYYYPRDQTHPEWKSKPIHTYHCETNMIGGMEQAQNLTGSIVIQGLPERVQNLVDSPVANVADKDIERLILRSHLLDATQVKLPRIYEGPWELNPRKERKDYGPTKRRRNHSMIYQMVSTADRVTAQTLPKLSSRTFRKSPLTTVRLDLFGKELLFEIRPAALLLSETSLKPYADSRLMEDLTKVQLPNIYPMDPTVGINPSHIYSETDKNYTGPFEAQRKPHIHLALLSNNMYKLRYEKPEQIEAKMLVDSFALAAAQARLLYGADVKELPEPVTINTAKFFVSTWLFGSYQLNSLDVGSSSAKNVFWLQRTQPVFTSAKIIDGVPNLNGFSPEFFRYFLALYSAAL